MSVPRSLACALALAPPASAGAIPPSYAHDFVTITHAGNRATLESERVFGASFAGFPNLGAVNYEYRIARTEVTAAQWLPFVEAFTPYWDSIGGSRLNSYFTSEILLPTNGNPNAPPGWTMTPGSPHRPVTIGVRMAAYYCNWLHNGRPLGTWANPVDFGVFLSGAYDASTFTQNPNLTYNDQVTRSAGALYWIPSLDEWTKAAHYDPNRYGQGQEGYWTSQGGQNTPLTSGLPGQGQTSAGSNFPQGFDPRSIPVGSYPDVMSPWGLLDTSGGVNEWTEEPEYNVPGNLPGFFRGRIVRGSFAGLGSSYVERDMIDSWSGGSVGGGIAGFRIASAIPGPGSGLALGLCALLAARRRRVAPLALASLALASHATAGVLPPSHGFDFVTIGAPGNRATLPGEVPHRPTLVVGAVNYEYRMARTEVTGSQWFAFVQAYAPYVGADFGNTAFTSGAIIFRGFGPGGVPSYSMDPVFNNVPIEMGWRYAARYCNWLHNGKALTQNAFANGAYDTATFTFNPDGTANDQLVRHPDALYWIPSDDEWVKAAYFDPHKHGLGMEGYWRHPGGQDTPLQGGLPGEPGAQTSAPITQPGFRPDVGSYPDVSAPWGLLDTSGGAREWTSSGSNNTPGGGLRVIRGSSTGFGANYAFLDQIDTQLTTSPAGANSGLRIASAVPAPGSGLALGLCALLAARRRRVVREQSVPRDCLLDSAANGS